jgi:ABC-2 type transport system permease protein
MTANAIMVIAYRDVMKFVRDPARVLFTLVFPLMMIAVLGGSLQSNLGVEAGYSFLTFTFTGVLAQTLFMSTTQGVASLIEDRENDFSQEMFVSPISRYAIIFGKLLGESLVALPQALGVVFFGAILGAPMSLPQLFALLPVAIVVSLFGAAFGVLILSNLGSRRAAEQVYTFVILPQFILAGVFTPIKVLPWYLDVFSRLLPMRYAVDLTRGVFYAGQSEYARVILEDPLPNVVVIGLAFAVFLVVGTALFVRREQNR